MLNRTTVPANIEILSSLFTNLLLHLCRKKVQRPQMSLYLSHKRNFINWKARAKNLKGSFLDLFVITDQSHHVLPCLLEKILLHTLPYVMMKESSFLVHQVVFPGEHRPSVSHSCVVADHHHRPVRFCQITARDGRGRLIVNTYLRMHFFFPINF